MKGETKELAKDEHDWDMIRGHEGSCLGLGLLVNTFDTRSTMIVKSSLGRSQQ